jgi:colicin import membrane protein
MASRIHRDTKPEAVTPPPQFGRRAADKLVAALIQQHAPEILKENIMPKALADTKQAALKEAVKKTGAVRPKHVPKAQADTTQGDSQEQPAVVESGSPAPKGSVFNPTTQEHIMTKDSKPKAADTKDTAATEAAKVTKQEQDAAKVKAAMEAKAAKQAAADKAKAEREAAAKVKAEQTAAKVKEREEAAAARKAAREAEAEKLKEGGRTYVGSMLALSERVKAGVYTKGLTGQLHTNDDLAMALDAVPPANVIKLGMLVLGHTENKYAALNPGQQSMNYRNLMRGAIKRGEKVGEQVITLDYVKSVRDAQGFATAEAEVAKKAEAKAAREKAQAEAKALREKAAADKAEAAKKAKAEADAKKAKPAEAKPAANVTDAGAANHTAT